MAVGVVGAGVFLGGCRTDVNVTVQSDKEGSGRVSIEVLLDKGAAAVLRDRQPGLVFDDLTKAGWSVGGPADVGDGAMRILADHAFANPDQANQLLKSLTGTTGAFSSVTVKRTSVYVASTISITGNVDLSKGLSSFGDDKLRALTNSASNLGIDDAEIERQAKTPVATAFQMVMKTDVDGTSKTWKIPLGKKTPINVSEQSIGTDVIATFLTGCSALVGLLLLWRSGRAERRRTSQASVSGT